MPNLAIDTVKINLDTIRAVWGRKPKQKPEQLPQKTLPQELSWEEHMQMMKARVQKMKDNLEEFIAAKKAKHSIPRKKVRSIVVQRVISLLVPIKNRTARAHRKTSKSVIGNLSSGKSDGSDPDPDCLPSFSLNLYANILLSTLIPLLAIFACTSINGVAK